MKKQGLSPGELGRARTDFYLFVFFNVISFTLLGQNIITLYALRLGAGNLLIGFISSFLYLGFLFMMIGRLLARRMGIVRLMGRFWLIRYLMMIPLLFSPLLAPVSRESALLLLLVSVLGFYLSRGIAITGYNPVVGEIASEKDRGVFLARVQAIEHVGTVVVSTAMIFFLGREAPLYRYSVFIATGILFGFGASSMFFRLPEPSAGARGFSKNLWSGFLAAFRRSSFRKFILIQFLILLVTFMVVPFLIVYIKKVYHQGDNLVVFFTLVGSIGAVFMALASGFMIDKFGARPLLFIFTAVPGIALLAMILSPTLSAPGAIVIFASAIFFFHHMGRFGILNAGQNYFFSVIKPEERLNLGIIHYLSLGLAGGLGPIAGGALLTWLRVLLSPGPSPAEAAPDAEVFRIFALIAAALLVITLFLIRNLESVGAYPIRDVLSFIFSPRDLRALSLLHRLHRSRNVVEEKDTIRALATSPSELPVEEILKKLGSPRFTIRAEALNALSSLPVGESVAPALVSAMKNQPYTTAYLAADILGQKGIRSGIKALRRSLRSRDYFLSGKCMISLARLGDRESIPAIEEILQETNNPRLIIHGAVALEIFKNTASIPLLLARLEKKTSPYLRDELILAMAGILDFGDWFYPHYVTFLEKSTEGISGLLDFASGRRGRIDKAEIEELLDLLLQDRAGFRQQAGSLLSRLALVKDGIDISTIFSRALQNESLSRLDRFCFLVAAVVIWFSSG